VTVTLPDIGVVEGTLAGYSTGNQSGFDRLELVIADPAGQQIAMLTAVGVVVDARGKQATGDLSVKGDGARLRALLRPNVRALLPPAIAEALSMLDAGPLSVKINALSVGVNATGGVVAGGNELTITAAARFVDAEGSTYSSPQASLTIHEPTMMPSPDGKTQQIEGKRLVVEGLFTKKGKAGQIEAEGQAELSARNIAVLIDGAGAQVTATDVRLSGHLVVSSGKDQPAPTREQQIAKIKRVQPVIENIARLIKSAEVHTHTPVVPGLYGRSFPKRVTVAPGTMLNLALKVLDQKLVVADTHVTFTPPLHAPLGSQSTGVALEARGTQAAVQLGVKLLDRFSLSLDQTKGIVGTAAMSLDLTMLVRRVPRRARAFRQDPDPADAPLARARASHMGRQRQAGRERTGQEHHSTEELLGPPESGGAFNVDLSDAPDAEHEPRSPLVTDLVSKGLDLLGTGGTADVMLATADKEATLGGLTLPPGTQLHLHGKSTAPGQVTLTSEEIGGKAGGNSANAGGVRGQVRVAPTAEGGVRVDVRSFTLQNVQIALPTKK